MFSKFLLTWLLIWSVMINSAAVAQEQEEVIIPPYSVEASKMLYQELKRQQEEQKRIEGEKQIKVPFLPNGVSSEQIYVEALISYMQKFEKEYVGVLQKPEQAQGPMAMLAGGGQGQQEKTQPKPGEYVISDIQLAQKFYEEEELEEELLDKYGKLNWGDALQLITKESDTAYRGSEEELYKAYENALIYKDRVEKLLQLKGLDNTLYYQTYLTYFQHVYFPIRNWTTMLWKFELSGISKKEIQESLLLKIPARIIDNSDIESEFLIQLYSNGPEQYKLGFNLVKDGDYYLVKWDVFTGWDKDIDILVNFPTAENFLTAAKWATIREFIQKINVYKKIQYGSDGNNDFNEPISFHFDNACQTPDNNNLNKEYDFNKNFSKKDRELAIANLLLTNGIYDYETQVDNRAPDDQLKDKLFANNNLLGQIDLNENTFDGLNQIDTFERVFMAQEVLKTEKYDDFVIDDMIDATSVIEVLGMRLQKALASTTISRPTPGSLLGMTSLEMANLEEYNWLRIPENHKSFVEEIQKVFKYSKGIAITDEDIAKFKEKYPDVPSNFPKQIKADQIFTPYLAEKFKEYYFQVIGEQQIDVTRLSILDVVPKSIQDKLKSTEVTVSFPSFYTADQKRKWALFQVAKLVNEEKLIEGVTPLKTLLTYHFCSPKVKNQLKYAGNYCRKGEGYNSVHDTIIGELASLIGKYAFVNEKWSTRDYHLKRRIKALWPAMQMLWPKLIKAGFIANATTNEFKLLYDQIQDDNNPWALFRLSYLVKQHEMRKNADKAGLLETKLTNVAGVFGSNKKFQLDFSNTILSEDEKKAVIESILKRSSENSENLFSQKSSVAFGKDYFFLFRELFNERIFDLEHANDVKGKYFSHLSSSEINDKELNEEIKNYYDELEDSGALQGAKLLTQIHMEDNPDAQLEMAIEYVETYQDGAAMYELADKNAFVAHFHKTEQLLKAPLYKRMLVQAAHDREKVYSEQLKDICAMKMKDIETYKQLYYSIINNAKEIAAQGQVPEEVIDRARSMNEREWSSLKYGLGGMAVFIVALIVGKICTFSTGGLCGVVAVPLISKLMMGVGGFAGAFGMGVISYNDLMIKLEADDMDGEILEMKELGYSNQESFDEFERWWLPFIFGVVTYPQIFRMTSYMMRTTRVSLLKKAEAELMAGRKLDSSSKASIYGSAGSDVDLEDSFKLFRLHKSHTDKVGMTAREKTRMQRIKEFFGRKSSVFSSSVKRFKEEQALTKHTHLPRLTFDHDRGVFKKALADDLGESLVPGGTDAQKLDELLKFTKTFVDEKWKAKEVANIERLKARLLTRQKTKHKVKGKRSKSTDVVVRDETASAQEVKNKKRWAMKNGIDKMRISNMEENVVTRRWMEKEFIPRLEAHIAKGGKWDDFIVRNADDMSPYFDKLPMRKREIPHMIAVDGVYMTNKNYVGWYEFMVRGWTIRRMFQAFDNIENAAIRTRLLHKMGMPTDHRLYNSYYFVKNMADQIKLFLEYSKQTEVSGQFIAQMKNLKKHWLETVVKNVSQRKLAKLGIKNQADLSRILFQATKDEEIEKAKVLWGMIRPSELITNRHAEFTVKQMLTEINSLPKDVRKIKDSMEFLNYQMRLIYLYGKSKAPQMLN